MKSIINCTAIVLCFLLCFALAACNGNTNEPSFDFKAVKDTETGTIYALGDPQEKFDKAFGEADISEYDVYRYMDIQIYAAFEEGDADTIGIRNFERFELMDVTPAMSADDLIAAGFSLSIGTRDFIHYSRYYDEKGNTVDEEQAAYVLTVRIADGAIANAEIYKK